MALAAAWRLHACTDMPSRLALAFSRTKPLFTMSNQVTRSCVTAASDEVGNSPHRVALVTGASRGLGLEFATQLLQRPNQRYSQYRDL